MSGDVFAVTSGKGGVGKTTTTVNLAIALRQRGHSVAVVDADLGMPNVAAFLSSETLDPPSVHRRLLSRLSGSHWFRQRVEATVRELDAMERRSDR